jgi:hypothetical protein
MATASASSKAAKDDPHPPQAKPHSCPTPRGVEVPLPLRSRGPSTPQIQQLYRYGLALFYSGLDN